MEAFEDAVGLGVKGSGGNVGYVEERGKVGPKGGNELGTPVRGDGVRNTKTGNPSGTQGISTGVGGRGTASTQRVVRSMMVKMWV
jgi:hypothetical protein